MSTKTFPNGVVITTHPFRLLLSTLERPRTKTGRSMAYPASPPAPAFSRSTGWPKCRIYASSSRSSSSGRAGAANYRASSSATALRPTLSGRAVSPFQPPATRYGTSTESGIFPQPLCQPERRTASGIPRQVGSESMATTAPVTSCKPAAMPTS